MKDLNTSLLREKFVIQPAGKKESKGVVTALSNRMTLELSSPSGATQETFIVRAQNMHCAVRMSARIHAEFDKRGTLLDRDKSQWSDFWDSILSEYEREFNPSLWGAVYANGKALFKHGTVHPLFDLIEKFSHETSGSYEDSIIVAENAFIKAGKNVKIEYDGNFALVIDIAPDVGRFGIILRGADRTTTFNFSARPKDGGTALNYAQCMMAAAAYLEGIQLAFTVGMNNVKILYGIIEPKSYDEKKTKEGRARLNRLMTEIYNLENAYDVRYRPEKPEIPKIVNDAEGIAEHMFEPVDGSDIVG